MGKTGVRLSEYPRYTALLVIACFLVTLVSCGGGSSNSSVPADKGPLALSTSSLTFNYTIHDVNQPAAQTINVTSTSQDGSPVDFTATTDVTNPNWLSVQPSNGIAQPGTVTPPTKITITALPSNLGAGTYTGHVFVVGTNARATATITFKVVSTTAAIMDVTVPPAVVPPNQTNPCQNIANCMVFTAVQGGTDPQAQLFSVMNDNPSSDPLDMHFALATATASGGSWMDACVYGGLNSGTCEISGIATSSVSVQPHVGSLPAGTYTGTVTVSASGAQNSPATVNIVFVVTTP